MRRGTERCTHDNTIDVINREEGTVIRGWQLARTRGVLDAPRGGAETFAQGHRTGKCQRTLDCRMSSGKRRGVPSSKGDLCISGGAVKVRGIAPLEIKNEKKPVDIGKVNRE